MKSTFWEAVALVVMLGLGSSWSAAAGEHGKGKVELPPAAARAIRDSFPDARVTEVGQEREGGVTLFEVELKTGGQESKVEVTADGVIVEVEVEVDLKQVPAPAARAIEKAAAGAKIKEIAKEELRAEVNEAKVVKLDRPKTVYSAELKRGEERGEIGVTADGTVVEELTWRPEGQEEQGAGEPGGR